ncbi:MAG TPA: hypothetical protein P5038_00455 [Candidatus Paceibacterota bacterium]|nr:hypothetical protein [Candidatus Paceibacterota bacterium]HRT55074.1 hypothetical protein [Candidatus Paceibacterota bacterium]
MADSDNKHPIDKLADAIKERPVESLIAYDILVSDAKKKEINENAAGWGVILVLAVFVLPLLIAPALEPLLINRELEMKAAGAGATTVEEIVEAGRRFDRHVLRLRITLWAVAVLSWIALLVMNLSYWRCL